MITLFDFMLKKKQIVSLTVVSSYFRYLANLLKIMNIYFNYTVVRNVNSKQGNS